MILLGFLLQWPTLLTLVMFPVLLVMYGRLAVSEERDMHKEFGAAYEAYALATPRFIPRLRRTHSNPQTVAVRPNAGVALALKAMAKQPKGLKVPARVVFERHTSR